MESRWVEIERRTRETLVVLRLNPWGIGDVKIEVPGGFFRHMLELMFSNALFDVDLKAEGDTDVDWHHLVEDVGIVFGKALKKSLVDVKGIKRYGFFILPMDEAISEVAIDVSGRAVMVYEVPDRFHASSVSGTRGIFPMELVEEFWRAFSRAGFTVHITLKKFSNVHHGAESIFKAMGRCLREAVSFDERLSDEKIPSTKGIIE